nr:MAG TPA: hypothetical protein [Caudoviricetes sp.]
MRSFTHFYLKAALLKTLTGRRTRKWWISSQFSFQNC